MRYWEGKALEAQGAFVQAAVAMASSVDLLQHELRGVTNLCEMSARLEDLSSVHVNAGNNDAAILSGERAVHYSRRALSEERSARTQGRVVGALRQMGMALSNAGRSAEALATFTEALVQGATLPDEEAWRANLNYLIARIHADVGDAAAAIPHFEAALYICEGLRSTAPDDDVPRQDILVILADLAAVYEACGRAEDLRTARSRLSSLKTD
jgi:tetratricopeptide (TPR) repeat protein